MEPEKFLFQRLSESRFRSSFTLKGMELSYLRQKGITVILSHGRDFIEERLKPAVIKNDGRQTPMKNHPFFIAQHATGMCCRKCLEKWHRIKKGSELTEEEIEYILSVAGMWLEKFL